MYPSHFKSVEELLKWYKSYFPKSYKEYIDIKNKIKNSKFRGSAKLLKNLENSKTITNFLSFFAEINVANLLLDKSVRGLSYEPKELSKKADLVFKDVAISIKSLQPKEYVKDEAEKISKLENSGGGTVNINYKNLSNIEIEVIKEGKGFSCKRTEIGHNSFCDTDIIEMSVPLCCIGEFENLNIERYKKVLFFYIQSSEFDYYYINDINSWYFERSTKDYRPIFEDDPSWYYKLFKKETKKNNIDAIVFMYRTNDLLWSPDSITEVNKDGKARLTICARERMFYNRLKQIFS